MAAPITVTSWQRARNKFCPTLTHRILTNHAKCQTVFESQASIHVKSMASFRSAPAEIKQRHQTTWMDPV